MTKRAESKYKINRRLGVNLWGRPKSPINKREYGPGQHGQRRKKADRLRHAADGEAEAASGYYGNISEKQFRNYYEEAVRRKGDTSRVPDRVAGAAAGRGGVSHEVRHHPVRRAAVRLAWARAGEWEDGEHPSYR